MPFVQPERERVTEAFLFKETIVKNFLILVFLFLTACGGGNEQAQTPPPVLGDCMSANALLASYGNPLLKVESADFDGTNDYMTRADLTGAADGKSGILSLWLRIDGGDGTTLTMIADGTAVTGRFYLTRLSSNIFLINAFNSGGTQILNLQTSGTHITSATWLHILSSWDLAAGVSSFYINDVSDQVVTTRTNDTIDYLSGIDWAIGANNAGGLKTNGCMAELYFAPNQYLDFSIVENRRKFISPNGKPVALGTNGSLPTGTAPIIYLHLDPAEAPADFATNRGTGGNFSITGTLTAGSTSPSD
jgi:hypothetical protein